MPSRTAHHDDDLLARGTFEHYDDASYYDFTYRTRRADIAFYRRLAKQVSGPILDIGGGSGRVAIPLVQDGHEVVVLDASEAMLERARANAERHLDADERKRLTVRAGDMRAFALRRKFALVLAPFNVVQHLYEPDDFARCFRCVGRHLARDAEFVFDVRVPILSELQRDPHRVYWSRGFRHPTLGHTIKYSETFRYDPIKQVQHIRIRFLPGPDAPRGTPVLDTLLTQRQIFPNELRALLALGGLRLVKRQGDFTGRPLSPHDAQQVVFARVA